MRKPFSCAMKTDSALSLPDRVLQPLVKNKSFVTLSTTLKPMIKKICSAGIIDVSKLNTFSVFSELNANIVFLYTYLQIKFSDYFMNCFFLASNQHTSCMFCLLFSISSRQKKVIFYELIVCDKIICIASTLELAFKFIKGNSFT